MPNVSPNYTRLIVRGAIALSALLVVVVVIAAVSPKPKTQTLPADPVSIETADSDGDGVINSVDLCPNTDPGEAVNPVHGCSDNELHFNDPTADVDPNLAKLDLIAIEGETGTAFTEGSVLISTSQSVAVSNFNGSADNVEFVVSASTAGSVSFTVSGLSPNTTYFKHTQGHLNEVQLTSSVSGSVTFTETISIEDLYVTLSTSSGTVTISASIILAADIIDNVVIDTSFVSLNCNGFTIGRTAGPPLPGVGLTINAGVTNVIVENCLFDFIGAEGILGAGGNDDSTFINNTFTRTGAGVFAVLMLNSNRVEITDSSCDNVFGGCFFLNGGSNAKILRNTTNNVALNAVVIIGGTSNLIANHTSFNTGTALGNLPAVVVDGSPSTIVEFSSFDTTIGSAGILFANGTNNGQIRDTTLTNIDSDGIGIIDSNFVSVLRNTISTEGHGVLVLNSPDATVNNNTIGPLLSLLDPIVSTGIFFLNGADRGSADTNTIFGGAGGTLSGGIIFETNTVGTTVTGGSATNNTITDILFGIDMEDPAGGTVSNTNVQFNTIAAISSPAFGLNGTCVFAEADNSTIKNNNCSTTGDGYVCQFDPNCEISFNTATGGVGSAISSFDSIGDYKNNVFSGFTGGSSIVSFFGTVNVLNNTIEPGAIIGPLVRGITILGDLNSSVKNNTVDCTASVAGGGTCVGSQDQVADNSNWTGNNFIQTTFGGRYFTPTNLTVGGTAGFGNSFDSIERSVLINNTIFSGASTATFTCNDFFSDDKGFVVQNTGGDDSILVSENRIESSDEILSFTGGWNLANDWFHNNQFSPTLAANGTAVFGDGLADLHNPALGVSGEGNFWNTPLGIFDEGVNSNHPAFVGDFVIDDPSTFATESGWPDPQNCTPSTIVVAGAGDVCDLSTVLNAITLQGVPLQAVAGTFSYEPFVGDPIWDITITGPGNAIFSPDFPGGTVEVVTDPETTATVNLGDAFLFVGESTTIEINKDGSSCDLKDGSVDIENNSIADILCLLRLRVETTHPPGSSGTVSFDPLTNEATITNNSLAGGPDITASSLAAEPAADYVATIPATGSLELDLQPQAIKFEALAASNTAPIRVIFDTNEDGTDDAGTFFTDLGDSIGYDAGGQISCNEDAPCGVFSSTDPISEQDVLIDIVTGALTFTNNTLNPVGVAATVLANGDSAKFIVDPGLKEINVTTTPTVGNATPCVFAANLDPNEKLSYGDTMEDCGFTATNTSPSPSQILTTMLTSSPVANTFNIGFPGAGNITVENLSTEGHAGIVATVLSVGDDYSSDFVLSDVLHVTTTPAAGNATPLVFAANLEPNSISDILAVLDQFTATNTSPSSSQILTTTFVPGSPATPLDFNVAFPGAGNITVENISTEGHAGIVATVLSVGDDYSSDFVLSDVLHVTTTPAAGNATLLVFAANLEPNSISDILAVLDQFTVTNTSLIPSQILTTIFHNLDPVGCSLNLAFPAPGGIDFMSACDVNSLVQATVLPDGQGFEASATGFFQDLFKFTALTTNTTNLKVISVEVPDQTTVEVINDAGNVRVPDLISTLSLAEAILQPGQTLINSIVASLLEKADIGNLLNLPTSIVVPISFDVTLPPGDCYVIIEQDQTNNTALVEACDTNPGDITFDIDGLLVTIAPGQTRLLSPDTDGDGVMDVEDACVNTTGPHEGCPVGDENEVVLHTIDRTKTRCPGGAGSCKEPIVGAVVRVFDRNDPAFQAAHGGKNPSGTIYDQVFEQDLGRVGTCTTAATGQCTAGEETTGDYLVIVKFIEAETGKIGYTGLPKSPSDFVDTDGDLLGDLAFKDFQFIKVVNKNGTVALRAANKTVITGSELTIIDPQYVLWESDTEVYPFLFTSDSDWTVDVCLRVPQGYTILEGDCNQVFLAGETKDLLFTVQRTGSPPPNFGVKFKARDPKGKLHVLDHDIPGLDVAVEKAPVELPDKAQPRGVPFQAQAQAQPQGQKSGFWCRSLGWLFGGLCR